MRRVYRVLFAELHPDRGAVRVLQEKPDDTWVPGVGVLQVDPFRSNASVWVVLDGLRRHSPETHFYVAMKVPKLDFAPGFYADAERERLTWIVIGGDEIDSPGLVPMGLLGGQMRWFRQLQGKGRFGLPLDAVVTAGSPGRAMGLSLNFSTGFREVPGICRHESSVSAQGVSEPWGAFKPAWRTRLMAATSMPIWHAFLTTEQKALWVKHVLAPNLSPAAREIVLEHSEICKNGLDVDEIDAIIGGMTWDRGRSVGVFTRVDAYKGTKESWELAGRLAATGRIDRINITTQHPSKGDPYPGEMPCIVDYRDSCSREDYLKTAARTAVAIVSSREGTSPIADVECALAGCVPLLPDREWIRVTWGVHGYRWIYPNHEVAAGMALKILDSNGAEGRYAREFAIKHFDQAACVDHFMGFVRRAADQACKVPLDAALAAERFPLGTPVRDSLEAIVAGGTASWESIRDGLYIPRDNFGVETIVSKNDVPELLWQLFNMRDDVNSAIPAFTR